MARPLAGVRCLGLSLLKANQARAPSPDGGA